MSAIQKLFTAFLSQKAAADLEAESRSWMVRCPSCSFERSIWELGGIRWKAAGNPRRYMRCPQCGKGGWHTISRQ
jgi:DNA-directed RNA polymerase subunit RPC12/RpoP